MVKRMRRDYRGRAIRHITLLLLVAATLPHSALLPAGELSREAQRRAVERQARAVVAKSYTEAHTKAQSQYLSDLAGACQWLVAQQAQAEAKKVVDEIEKSNAKFGRLSELQKAVADIAAAKPLDEAKQKELAGRLKNARQSRAKGFLDLASTCFRAGLFGLAYDLVWDVFDADPDNQTAHAAMGQVKVGNEWLSQYAALQIQKGNKYLPDMGWVAASAVDKAQKGEWFENGRLIPLADADKVHANLAIPWVIETENFTLKATTTRKVAIAMAEHLESIRAACFRQYLEFFMRGSGKRGAQLLFNQTAPQKMVVWYLGTKEDLETTVRKEVKGQGLDVLLRSVGFYHTHAHASFFQYDEKFGSWLVTLMQHEVTHQIVGEYARGWTQQTWLAEGVAVCLQEAKPAEHGKLVVPCGLKHAAVSFAADLLAKNTLPSVAELMGMAYENFHQEPGRSRNYMVAGALCRCLLEIDDGAYAEDFLEFLYDSHRGGKTVLADYIGMDAATLDKRFRQYLKDGR